MNFTKWLSVGAAIVLIIACFLPWVTIQGIGTISGVAAPERFGKPAYFHFICIALFFIGLFSNKLWTKYMAVVAAAFNIAWSIRSFTFSSCEGGICPEKHIALYITLVASILMMIGIAFAKVQQKPVSPEEKY